MLPYASNVKQEDDEVSFDLEKIKEVKWYHQILLNRSLRFAFGFLLIGVLAPLLIYHFLFVNSVDPHPVDGLSIGSCLLPRDARLLCGVGIVNQSDCHPQCCYDFNANICFHRFPSRFSYISNTPWDEHVVLHPRVPRIPFKNQDSLIYVRLSIDEVSETHLSLKFYNSEENSFEGNRIDNKTYSYNISVPELNVIVNGTQGSIFNTIRGPLIASENIWEIAFKLTEETMYGLGEIPLEEDTVKVIYSYKDGLSSIPLIFAKSNGSYHGLLIDVKEPTEVRIQGHNNIVVRSITTDGLKFHIFVGPQPKDVMRDVMKLIGFNKQLEYWMLGAHVCSEVSETPEEAFGELSSFLEETGTEKIPFESHCGTKPIVFHNSECESVERDYIERGAELLRDMKKRFVAHVSPYIRFEEIERTSGPCPNIALEYGEFMLRENDTGNIYTSTVGEYDVFYPDYGNVTTDFLNKLWIYDIKPEGLVLENNWPLDNADKPHEDANYNLPYFSEHFERAFNDTPRWDILRPNEERYMDTHNEYGNNFVNALKEMQENVTILTTSQWMYGNVGINKQNVPTSWLSLQNELVEAALGGVSGHWLWTSPICGDTENFDLNTHTNLCVKWYMAATYLPMLKIHSKKEARHPLAFIGTNRRHITRALNTRLSLLPYFYATLQNGPLLRPMFYQFPNSTKLTDLKSQLSVGDGLLIVPNLHPSQTHVHVRLPPGTWYELWSGLELEGEEGDVVTMTTTEADFLTLVRGGSIIVMQKDVEQTAEETRLHSDFSLTIALECKTTSDIDVYFEIFNTTECHANGTLYITKDIFLKFEADDENLTIRTEDNDLTLLCDVNEAHWAHAVKEINVYGLNEESNNYDHYRHVNATINLCQLVTSNEIVFTFVDQG